MTPVRAPDAPRKPVSNPRIPTRDELADLRAFLAEKPSTSVVEAWEVAGVVLALDHAKDELAHAWEAFHERKDRLDRNHCAWCRFAWMANWEKRQ